MSDDKKNGCEDNIESLKQELQQQRGMLWLFGEIMKAAVSIASFKKLMSELTDMLMGVLGVTNCFLWIRVDNKNKDDYTAFFRSIELNNEFKEVKNSTIPTGLKHLHETYVFEYGEIENSLMKDISLPGSRIAVPLESFSEHEHFGVLVVEHGEKDFFTNATITFFETLAIFISSKAQNSWLLQSEAEKSVRDPLTEVYNRRHLGVSLKDLKTKYPHVTAAVVDTDNFKNINDELGHIEGDTVLKAIAQLARGIVQECNGEVVRYGGDEFVILLPCPLTEAIHILEEFRKSVHYLKVAYDLVVNVSVTLGVCSYPEMIGDYSQIIAVADRALLRGKAQGKNRVVLATEEDLEVDIAMI